MINETVMIFSHWPTLFHNAVIVIPTILLQGRGIFLTRSFDNVPQTDNVVAQVYIKKPLLLDGFKFDLRLCEFWLKLV
jgi:Tubulin-tyrosine ligase family